jgi:hypothetical protein
MQRIFFLIFSCKTSPVNKVQEVVLSTTYDTTTGYSNIIKVPKQILEIRAITLENIFLRQGPAVSFPIGSNYLTKASHVVVLDKVGKWYNIYEPKQKLLGWIHYQSLGPILQFNGDLIVDIEIFPSVFIAKKNYRSFSYVDKKSQDPYFASGKMLYKLLEKGDLVLAMFPENRSIFWINKKDIQ